MPDGLFANPLHWVILIVVALIVFGPGKLPGVGAALGKSVREFKKATLDDSPGSSSAAGSSHQSTTLPASVPVVTGWTCPQCDHENEAGARFCGSCGASLVIAAEPVADAVQAEPASSGPVQCLICQTENPSSNRFCAHCGRLLGPQVPNPAPDPIEARPA